MAEYREPDFLLRLGRFLLGAGEATGQFAESRRKLQQDQEAQNRALMDFLNQAEGRKVRERQLGLQEESAQLSREKAQREEAEAKRKRTTTEAGFQAIRVPQIEMVSPYRPPTTREVSAPTFKTEEGTTISREPITTGTEERAARWKERPKTRSEVLREVTTRLPTGVDPEALEKVMSFIGKPGEVKSFPPGHPLYRVDQETGGLSFLGTAPETQTQQKLTSIHPSIARSIALGLVTAEQAGLPPTWTPKAAEKYLESVENAELEQAKNQSLFAAQEAKAWPAETQNKIQALGDADLTLKEMDRLLRTKKIRLDMIMGGLNPWLNEIRETGKLWFIPIGVTPPEILTKNMENNPIEKDFDELEQNLRLKGLNNEEIAFLSTIRAYADNVLRLRSGAQINEQEYKRMLRFLPTEFNIPSVFLARLNHERRLNAIRMESWNWSLSQGGYRTLTGTPTLPGVETETDVSKKGTDPISVITGNMRKGKPGTSGARFDWE